MNITNTLVYIFMVFPQFSLAQNILSHTKSNLEDILCRNLVEMCMDLKNYTLNKCWEWMCQTYSKKTVFCCGRETHYLESGFGPTLLYPITTGVICFIVLFMIEQRKFVLKCVEPKQHRKPIRVPNEDGDVKIMKEDIQRVPIAELANLCTVVAQNATEYNGHRIGVNGICVKLKNYECVALLGIDASGKSTFLQMLAGVKSFSYGDAYVNGYSTRTQFDKVQKIIGYCGPSNVLLEHLTTKETLRIFALLRGIKFDEFDSFIHKLANDFGISKHLDTQIKRLDKAAKQRIGTIIALIDHPAVLLLNQPSAGMDTVSRNNLWRILRTERENGRCIVLATKSVEECRALATKLAIIVDGNFKCYGSLEYLERKFCEGFTLKIRMMKNLRKSSENAIFSYVKKNFPNSELRERHLYTVTFYLWRQGAAVSVSQLFGIMEEAAAKLEIEHYAIGQENLEKVNLNYANYYLMFDFLGFLEFLEKY